MILPPKRPRGLGLRAGASCRPRVGVLLTCNFEKTMSEICGCSYPLHSSLYSVSPLEHCVHGATTTASHPQKSPRAQAFPRRSRLELPHAIFGESPSTGTLMFLEATADKPFVLEPRVEASSTHCEIPSGGTLTVLIRG